MDFKRFGRLNSKKIEELKKERNKKSEDDFNLYEMARFFPYLTTRKKSMDQRHTISSFKTMIQKYRYAYSLYPNCIATIKLKGDKKKEEIKYIEIDNNVYVFTDISPYDFKGEQTDFLLLYDRDEKIPIHNDKKTNFSDMTVSILQNMKDRKLSPRQNQLLIDYLSPIHFISLKSEYIRRNDLDEAVYNEFVWRMALYLYGEGIYIESEIKEADIKRKESKRSRVEDDHTLFHGYNRYGSLEYLHAFSKKLNDAMSYNQKVTANKLFYEFLEENDNTFLLDEFTGNQLLSDALSIYEYNIEYLLAIKENYAFLKNPYSKGYRHYFSNIKTLHESLFKTQQVMRKLKNEYHSIDDMLNSLREERDKTITSMNVIQEAIKNYKENLGDNQLPNQGFGYSDDGWEGGSDENDAWHQERDAIGERLRQEKMDRESLEKERKVYDLTREEYYVQLLDEIGPLEFFKYDQEAYFEFFDSISITEVLDLYEYEVLTDVSLEGEFYSVREIYCWLAENCGTFRDEEGDIVL